MTGQANSKPRAPHLGTRLDDYLADEGVRDAFRAVAIKEVIAWHIEQAMKVEKLSKNTMSS